MLNILTPIPLSFFKNYSNNFNFIKIDMGSVGVQQGKNFISLHKEEVYKTLFLGLCGVIPANAPLYSAVLPSATAINLDNFRANSSLELGSLFKDLKVFSGKHYSFARVEDESAPLLQRLEQANVLSVDLEFSFLAEIAPNLKCVLFSTDNPLHGPVFTKESMKRLKTANIINSVLQILSRTENIFKK